MTDRAPKQAVATIKAMHPELKPRIAMILGSGLGAFADKIQNAVKIPYEDLPGFPISSVEGHSGCLVLGQLQGLDVACLQGRTHSYEGTSPAAMKAMIRTLKLLGVETLLITNASGSLHEDMSPGSLMMISDHINMQGSNPLVGPNDDEFGERFFSMEDAYDPELRQKLKESSEKVGINLYEGVYAGVLGPCFETPAEIKAYKILGADAVGMSTVPDVLIARHCDLKVAAVAAITNLAAGMHPEKLSHDITLTQGRIVAESMSKLLLQFLEDYK